MRCGGWSLTCSEEGGVNKVEVIRAAGGNRQRAYPVVRTAKFCRWRILPQTGTLAAHRALTALQTLAVRQGLRQEVRKVFPLNCGDREFDAETVRNRWRSQGSGSWGAESRRETAGSHY